VSQRANGNRSVIGRHAAEFRAGDERGPRAKFRGPKRCYYAGRPCADNYDIEHGKISPRLCPRRRSLKRLTFANPEFSGRLADPRILKVSSRLDETGRRFALNGRPRHVPVKESLGSILLARGFDDVDKRRHFPDEELLHGTLLLVVTLSGAARGLLVV
jgi:hypothetical protein